MGSLPVPVMGRPTDPWNWSIDDVVNQICRPNNLLDARPNTRLPEPTTLEQLIRAQGIDGSTLLLHVDMEFLQAAGVSMLGERSALIYVRDRLRARSLEYHNHAASEQHSESISRLQAPTILTRHEPEVYEHSTSTPIPAVQAPLKPTALPGPKERSSLIDQMGTASSTRPQETYVQDDSGRKRRRLNLASTSKLVPTRTFGEVQMLPSRLELIGSDFSGRFLPPKKHPVDKIFFDDSGSCDDGSFNADIEADLTFGDSGHKFNGPNFTFLSRTSVPGASTYVYRQMLHYLRQEPVTVKTYGHNVSVLYPYQGKFAQSAADRSLIRFKPYGDSLKAIHQKQEGLDFGEESRYLALDSEDWAFLSRWRPNDTKTVAVDGESDDESTSSYKAELEAERKEDHRAQDNKYLTPAAVTATIDSAIQEFIEDWTGRKLQQLEAKAYRWWKSVPTIGERIARASTADKRVSTLSKRLDDTAAKMKIDKWSKASNLRRVCEALQPTVFEREELKFKADIWRRYEAPPHVLAAAKPRARKKTPNRYDSEEDGDIVSSDDDGFASGYLRESIEDDLPSERARAPSDDDLDIPDQSTSALQPYVIDLTMLSSSDGEQARDVHRALIGTVHKNGNERNQDPEDAPDIAVHHWSLEGLQAEQDRRRLVVKLLRNLEPAQYSKFRSYVINPSEDSATTQTRLRRETLSALKAIRDGNHRLPLYDPEQSEEPIRAAHLFACWYYCSSRYFLRTPLQSEEAVELSTHVQTKKKDLLDFTGLVERTLHKHTSAIRRDHPLLDFQDTQRDIDSADPDPSSLDESMHATFEDDMDIDKQFEEPDEDELDEGTPPEDVLLHISPRRKRKRAVDEDKGARERRERARRNLESQEQRKLTLMSSSLAESALIAVNPGKSDEYDFIYLNSHISSRIHKHQIEGIQFLWREVVATDMKETDRQGALLSHTMGLGKTMQAISLITTIAEAVASPNPRIREQIPPALRESRTLVMCPATLISNWVDEFEKWMPPNVALLLGDLSAITSDTPKEMRPQIISKWSEDGGVLLISYELFRAFINNSGKSANRLSEEEHETILNQLTQDPHIVIADEAHKMKNPKSGIAKATTMFKTSARIALTGSPLSNNLSEYYAMIDWIAPGYLGNATEFRAYYEEPIRDGGYVDSSPYERRKAMRKLKVLEEVTEPKIHRRDVTVLQGTLAAKTEFVLTLPLTEVQEKLYISYLATLSGQNLDEYISQTRIFEWLGTLSSLCSHPMAFFKKLEERKEELEEKNTAPSKQGHMKDQSDSEDVPTPQAAYDVADDVADDAADNDQDVATGSGLSLSTIEDLLKITQEVTGGELDKVSHSIRTMLLRRILKRSKANGDQVLVFSQSLPTLDFLEQKLVQWKIAYFRLDGSTPIKKRPGEIKAFNEHKRDAYLISTRAGGLGVNLPAANRVVIFDFMFNPQWEEQAIGRAYRIGQQKPVYVYRFVAGGTFEEKLFNIATFKTQLAFKVIEKKNTKNYAQRGMNYLFKPKKVEQADLQEHKGKDTVLDSILDELEPDADGKYLIRKLISAEILKDPAEDVEWTQEDQQEVQQDLANYRLRKERPAAYNEQQRRMADKSSYFGDILGSQWSNRTPQTSAAQAAPVAPMMPTADEVRSVWPATQIPRDRTNGGPLPGIAGLASTQPRPQAISARQLADQERARAVADFSSRLQKPHSSAQAMTKEPEETRNTGGLNGDGGSNGNGQQRVASEEPIRPTERQQNGHDTVYSRGHDRTNLAPALSPPILPQDHASPFSESTSDGSEDLPSPLDLWKK